MQGTRRRVTAKDVAAQAGVSQSTVSYVLNDTPHQTISPATRARVLDAVERLGYAPSAAARALRTGASSTVMLVLPDAPIGATIAQLIEVLSDTLDPHGYTVLFRRHRGSELLSRAWKEIRPVAIANLAAFEPAQEAAIRNAGIPLVSAPLDGVGADVISVPEVPIGRLQAAHLLERGHTRLGYAAPTDVRVSGFYDLRLQGVREVLAAARLPEPIVIPIPPDATAAAAALSPWVSEGHQRVSAVCAYNDELAFVVLAGMRILHLRAPGDLAVVGVDNVPLAPFADPPLTSVDIDVPRIGAVMADALLAAIRGEHHRLPQLSAELVRRESS